MSKRHIAFNVIILLVPWSSLLFMDNRSKKRYYLAGLLIVILELFNAKIGQKLKFWKFNGDQKSFFKNEFPFSVGPYMPISMWLLKLSFGKFKLFLFLNAIADAMFAFPLVAILRKSKIADLHKINEFQFFLYLFYKAFILYGFQYFLENKKKTIRMVKDLSLKDFKLKKLF